MEGRRKGEGKYGGREKQKEKDRKREREKEERGSTQVSFPCEHLVKILFGQPGN